MQQAEKPTQKNDEKKNNFIEFLKKKSILVQFESIKESIHLEGFHNNIQELANTFYQLPNELSGLKKDECYQNIMYMNHLMSVIMRVEENMVSQGKKEEWEQFFKNIKFHKSKAEHDYVNLQQMMNDISEKHAKYSKNIENHDLSAIKDGIIEVINSDVKVKERNNYEKFNFEDRKRFFKSAELFSNSIPNKLPFIIDKNMKQDEIEKAFEYSFALTSPELMWMIQNSKIKAQLNNQPGDDYFYRPIDTKFEIDSKLKHNYTFGIKALIFGTSIAMGYAAYLLLAYCNYPVMLMFHTNMNTALSISLKSFVSMLVFLAVAYYSNKIIVKVAKNIATKNAEKQNMHFSNEDFKKMQSKDSPLDTAIKILTSSFYNISNSIDLEKIVNSYQKGIGYGQGKEQNSNPRQMIGINKVTSILTSNGIDIKNSTQLLTSAIVKNAKKIEEYINEGKNQVNEDIKEVVKHLISISKKSDEISKLSILNQIKFQKGEVLNVENIEAIDSVKKQYQPHTIGPKSQNVQIS